MFLTPTLTSCPAIHCSATLSSEHLQPAWGHLLLQYCCLHVDMSFTPLTEGSWAMPDMTLQGKLLFTCNYKTSLRLCAFKANQADCLQQSVAGCTLLQSKLTKPALVSKQAAENLLPFKNCTGGSRLLRDMSKSRMRGIHCNIQQACNKHIKCKCLVAIPAN